MAYRILYQPYGSAAARSLRAESKNAPALTESTGRQMIVDSLQRCDIL